MRPEMHWAVEAYMPHGQREKGARLWDFKGEIGNLQVAKTELNTSCWATQKQWDAEGSSAGPLLGPFYLLLRWAG